MYEIHPHEKTVKAFIGLTQQVFFLLNVKGKLRCSSALHLQRETCVLGSTDDVSVCKLSLPKEFQECPYIYVFVSCCNDHIKCN